MAIEVFGLTGGIASGKSTVAARFRARGLPVIDADELAREVVAPGSAGLSELVAAFGGEILDPSGALNRKHLAALAFDNESTRQKLEAITHPRIAAAGGEQVARAEAEGHPLACYEAALLVERGLASSFRPLVVVHAPVALQIERAVGRGGLTGEEARARIEAQLPAEQKRQAGDFVIDNDLDMRALLRRADEVLDAICAANGISPGRYPRPA